MGDRIQEKFEKFHQDNPQILFLILRNIEAVKRAGLQHYSINGIFERIRWHVSVELRGVDCEPYKLNNNYRSRYVRLIEEKFPELRGFFETRTLADNG